MGKYSNNIERVTLVLSIGQSNEDGRGINSDLLAPYRTAITDANIYQKPTYSGSDNGVWETLEYNENNFFESNPSSPLEADVNDALHGSELYLGYDYVAAKSKPIYFIKHGRGGTNIHGDSQTTWNDALSPDLMTRYIEWYVQPAIKDLVEAAKYIDFQGVFWFQGYSDCDTAAHAAAWEANATEILDTRLRAGLSIFGDAFENVKIYIQESPDWGAVATRTQAFNDTLRVGQANVGALTNFELLPNTNYDGSFNADNIHIDSAGQKLIATQRLNKLT